MRDASNRPVNGRSLPLVIFGSFGVICAAAGVGVTSGAWRVVFVAVAFVMAAIAGGGLRVLVAGRERSTRFADGRAEGAWSPAGDPRPDEDAKR